MIASLNGISVYSGWANFFLLKFNLENLEKKIGKGQLFLVGFVYVLYGQGQILKKKIVYLSFLLLFFVN